MKEDKKYGGEEKFRSIFDTALVSNSITDKNGVFTEVNPTFLEITGYSNKKEVIGKSVSHFFENPGDLKKIMTLLKKEGKWSGEIIARRKDGSLFPVYGSCITLVDGDKKIVGYQSSMYDLTPRKKLEEELKENKKILEHAEEVANLGSYVLDINTGKWDSSPVLDKIFGIGKGCIYSVRTWENLIYPSDRKMMTDYFSNEVIRKRLLFNKEYRIVRKNDKQIRWVHGLGQLEFNAKKQPVKMIGTIQDITERKKSEEKLKESEEKYRIISENSKATMMLTLPDKTVSYLSPSSIDVFGWPAEDIMGKNKDIFYPEDRPKVFENLSKVLNGKSFKNFRYRIIGKDKKVYWISHSANPVFKNGKLVQVVSVIINIDEIKEAELEAEEYSERLKIATRAGKIGIWDWDIVKDNLIWDDTICELYGFPPGFFKGGAGKWSKHIIPEDRPRTWEELQAALRGEKEYCPEFRIAWPNGEIRHIKANSQAFFDKNGKAIRMVGTNMDITERKKSEEKLKLKNIVFDSSTAANSIADFKGVITEVNATFIKFWGYPNKEEVIGKSISYFLQNKFEVINIINNLNKAGKWEGDYTAIRKDGSTFIAHGLATVLKDENGNIAGYQSSVIDITERKRIEVELNRNLNILNETGKTAKVGGWEFDVKTLELIWSAETYRIHEVEESSFHPTVEKAINFYSPTSKPIIKKAVDLAIKRGEPFNLELEIITAKGNHKWIHAIGKIIRSQDGSKKLSGTFQDVTEKKKAEEELKKAKENVDKIVLERTAALQKQTTFLSLILDNIPDMVFVKDPVEFKFEEMNLAGEKLIGLKKKEILGKDLLERFSKSQAAFFKSKDKEVIRDKKLLDIPQESINTPHGEKILHTKKIPIYDDRGKPIYLLGISEDITNNLDLQKKYELLYESSADAIMTLAPPTWNFIGGNPATLRMFNVKDEKQFEALTPGDLSPKLQPDGQLSSVKAKKMIEQAMKDGKAFFEWVHKRHGGNNFFSTVLLSRIGEGNKAYLQATVRDITEMKNKEEEVKKRNIELERFNQIAIDRELKMIELKKKIKELESKEK